MLVDNSPHTYVFHKSNGVPIIPFYDNYEDKELLKLTAYLKTMSNCDDLRVNLNSSFRHDKVTENLASFD